MTENEEFMNRSLLMELDPVSVDILKNFTSQLSQSEPTIDAPQKMKIVRKNSKPVALSLPPSIPPIPQFELQMVEKRFTLPIFAFREKILNLIDQNRILLVQVRDLTLHNVIKICL